MRTPSRRGPGRTTSRSGEGYAWITWKGMMDISAMGRQLDFGMQAGKAKGVARAFADLERSGWTRPPDPVGFRYFNCSAYAVYRTANWMASIRASTPKIIGTETGINEDNVKGMCMADGALLTYVTGREYDRTGDYSTFMRAHIPTPVSGKVFSLRILHGKCPKGASYRYRIDTGAFEGRQL